MAMKRFQHKKCSSGYSFSDRHFLPFSLACSDGNIPLQEPHHTQPGGNFHIKKTKVLSVPLRHKKWFWFLFGCPASKCPQWELLRYLLWYWAEKYDTKKCVVLELVLLGG